MNKINARKKVERYLFKRNRVTWLHFTQNSFPNNNCQLLSQRSRMSNKLRSIIPPFSMKTVLTCLVWYMVSSVTSQLTKLILVKFTYPLFLSQFQFLIGAVLSLSVITIVKAFPETISNFPPGSVPNDPTVSTFKKSLLLKILPLGLFQFLGKFFSLSATSLIPLATVSSVKALSPLLIVLGYRIFYNVRFPAITYLSLTPLVGGVILIIASDSLHSASKSATPKSASTPGSSLLSNEVNEFDYSQLKGLTFCVLSTIIFATQNIYGKQLITWDSNTSNPASLALNTEISRPGTPSLNDTEKYSDKKHYDLYNSMSKPKHYIRQRTNSIKLPFSTSDLRAEDKQEEFQRQNLNNPYNQAVDLNNRNVNQMFGHFANPESVVKPDKMTIILYCSMVGFVFSFGGFILKELPSILYSLADSNHFKGTANSASDILLVIILIILDSLSHFFQTLLAFHLLGSIPTLSYSIASMMKRIVLIVVSILVVLDSSVIEHSESKWFGRVTTEQFYGLILIAIGLYSYDRWGSRGLKGG